MALHQAVSRLFKDVGQFLLTAVDMGLLLMKLMCKYHYFQSDWMLIQRIKTNLLFIIHLFCYSSSSSAQFFIHVCSFFLIYRLVLNVKTFIISFTWSKEMLFFSFTLSSQINQLLSCIIREQRNQIVQYISVLDYI
jgi:hypothetical protein